ncbi:MAG: hypothetical protein ACI8XO_003133 [Verrucomicrobiales bacterium]|jgi:hypothetical protein
MIRTITNWLRLDAQNFIAEVWWSMLALWIALVILAILSVRTQNLTRGSKSAWIAAIIGLPLIGLFTYCAFCLTRVDYYMVDFLFRKKKAATQAPPIPSHPGSRRKP